MTSDEARPAALVPVLTAVVVVLVAAMAAGAWIYNEKQQRISQCYQREFSQRPTPIEYQAVFGCLRREGVSDEEIARQFGPVD